jgi:hypothetical protein
MCGLIGHSVIWQDTPEATLELAEPGAFGLYLLD